MSTLSSLRARLASFENCYAVAIQQQRSTGHNQFVVQTGDPTRPYRVTTSLPADNEKLLTYVA